MAKETWKDIPSWRGLYQASNHGRIRSVRRWSDKINRFYGGMVVKQIPKRNEYLCVNLTCRGKRKQELVHRLVAEAFHGTPGDGLQVCHIDGTRANNTPKNLRWGTCSSNHSDKVRHKTWQGGERNGSARLTWGDVTRIRKFFQNGGSILDGCLEFGVSESHLRRIRSGKSWCEEKGLKAGQI